MRYHADECLDRQILLALIAAGADVTEAAALAKGATDSAVLANGNTDYRVVVTEDKGVGALVHREGRTSVGVVLIRWILSTPKRRRPLRAVFWHCPITVAAHSRRSTQMGSAHGLFPDGANFGRGTGACSLRPFSR